MFPSEYFGLFPPFPENNRVFVAMSFADRFSLRWEHVIDPGIRAAGLEPYRVDLSKVADSIPLKILREIGTCRLVFADVTSDNGVRNANVMYELGIAQSIRRPEEVIVFRSDSDALPFDISPIFADTYKPDSGPGSTGIALEHVKQAILRALQSVDLTRHLVVQKIVDSLDVATFEVLASYLPPPFQSVPTQLTLGKAIDNPRLLAGFSRLTALGVLRTSLPDFLELYERPETKVFAAEMAFELSPLGRAVAEEFTRRFYGGRSPLESYREFVRIKGAKLAQEGKLTATQVEAFVADASKGDATVLKRLRQAADDRNV